MSRLSKLIIVSVMLTMSLACVTLLGEPDDGISAPVVPIMIDTPIPEVPENLSCPAITDKIVDVNSPQFESGEETLDFVKKKATKAHIS